MATLEECRSALTTFGARLAGDDGSARKGRHGLERTISCAVPDLGVTFTGRLENGALEAMSTQTAPRAQIRFTAQSDDLVALTDGSLALASAWSSGRLKVDASVFDLLKLRSLL